MFSNRNIRRFPPSFSFRYEWVIILHFLFSLILIFFPKTWDTAPYFISVLLVLTACFSYCTFSSKFSIPFFSSTSFRSWFFLLLLLGVYFSFAFSPLYFSDDALRHIYDGYYLLQGVDVYSIPPNQLPKLLPELPNHSELPTTYFPFTQFQAMLGAMISSHYGFRLVYIAFCSFLVFSIWNFSSRRDRSFWAAIFVSPWFFIFLSSHHADVQGFLLLGWMGLAWKKIKRSESSMLSSLLVFLFAFSCGLLVGLKPDGLWWFLCLSSYFLIASRYPLFPKRYILPFVGGFLSSLFLQIAFASFFLFSHENAWASFRNTVIIFMDWFLAYNPILDLRTFFYENIQLANRPEIFRVYRTQILSVSVLCFFMIPGLFFYRRQPRTPKHFHFTVKTTIRSILFLETRRSFFVYVLLWGLVTILALKGAWNPWYFLWLLAALWGFFPGSQATIFSHSFARFLASSLPLFYLPVVIFRTESIWQMKSYYIAFIFYIIFVVGVSSIKNKWRGKSSSRWK